MTTKRHHAQAGRHESASIRREQALCVGAMESGEYDAMSDTEWVLLCEMTARETAEAQSE